MFRSLAAVNMAANTAIRAKAQHDRTQAAESRAQQREAEREARAAEKAADRELRARQMDARLELQRQQMMLNAGVPAAVVLSSPSVSPAPISMGQPVQGLEYPQVGPVEPILAVPNSAAMSAEYATPSSYDRALYEVPEMQAHVAEMPATAPLAAASAMPAVAATSAAADLSSSDENSKNMGPPDQVVAPVDAVHTRAHLQLSMSPIYALWKSVKGKQVVYYGVTVTWADGSRAPANLAFRYSEMLTLQESIIKFKPDMKTTLPPFPSKTTLFQSNSKQKLVELRLILLSHWLPFVLGHPDLVGHSLLEKLISASPSFDAQSK